VRSRTLLINHARGITKSSGARLPSCSAASFPAKVATFIPEPLRPAQLPLLDSIASLTQQIRAYDRQIQSLCQAQYPESQLLRQVPGVGYLTALAYLLTLEDPSRFRKSREVGPALGLIPKQDQSGDRDPQLRITPGLARQGRQDRQRLPAPPAGRLRTVHARPLRTRLRSAPLGPPAG